MYPQGSPPRVRGTALQGLYFLFPDRITPACAGNSKRHPVIVNLAEDHPRVCGEQKKTIAVCCWGRGSPPRVRGTEQPQSVGASNQRITPACAGNSPLAVARAAFAKDHPRVCGEQVGFISKIPTQLGSPPRVRGTVCEKLDVENTSRITPACAGNSAVAHK